MLERKEFGLRKRTEAPAPHSDFKRDRSVYERLRTYNKEIDQLLNDYDAIIAHQAAGNSVLADEREKERIQKRLEEIRTSQSH